MIIAIDGPAASGKGTLARRIAAHFGFAYLDTGAMYRAVARDVRRAGGECDDPVAAVAAARALDPASLDDSALRDHAIAEASSLVARIPGVRAALRDLQRVFAGRPPGAVLDGRDIGTIVTPNAEVKIFVVADPVVRARRRHAELTARGEAVTLGTILEDIRRRDARDTERDDSPMRPASDAVLLDTTALDIDGAFQAALDVIEARRTR